MSGQYRIKGDASYEKAYKETLSEAVVKEENKSSSNSKKIDFVDTHFADVQRVRSIYNAICDEYRPSIEKKFALLTAAKSQLPPYYNLAKNAPDDLPMYQHNVSSGRFEYSMVQLALPLNAFFPNQAYSKTLLEVKLLTDSFGTEFVKPQSYKDNPDSPESVLANLPGLQDSVLHDNAAFIEQAFDNLIKHSDWAKSEHLKMVSDALVYSCGLFYFPNPEDYHYQYIDFRKCKFPSGSTTNPEDWEYLFIEQDYSFSELLDAYENSSEASGWSKAGLKSFLCRFLEGHVIHTQEDTAITPGTDLVRRIDDVREGLTRCNFGKVAPARIPVVSCFYKERDGKIGTCMISTVYAATSYDLFLFEKRGFADTFCDLFSVFPGSEDEEEIRLVKGWGEKIHALCHAYDRSFCKFLDHVDHASTLFIGMDPNDLNKKIIYSGSMNIGSFESAQILPNGLNAVIAALTFLDAKIDQVTFTRGLNKTELQGDGRGAELATILLTTEGRIHKHLISRFIERYTIHYKKVMSKILNIANKKSLRTRYKDVDVKFYNFLMARGVPEDTLKADSASEYNHGVPSTWLVQARKQDGSGITSSIPHVIQALQPYMASLPEAGFKYLLGRIISESFGDEDMIQKVLPSVDLQKVTSEADLQTAEMQTNALTTHRSDFDVDIEALSEEINPQLSDLSKFVTFPANNSNDHIIFLTALLAKVDDAVQRMNRREIGRTTLHIWLYNLVSTAQGHVNLLRQDPVRSKRPEAAALFARFGNAFNLLRQVEAQANAEKAKKLDSLQQKFAEEAQDNPKRIEAIAKLETARARQAEVQLEYSTNQFEQALAVQKNRRAEESHVIDTRLKMSALRTNQLETAQNLQSQSLVGRPGRNEQRGGGEVQ